MFLHVYKTHAQAREAWKNFKTFGRKSEQSLEAEVGGYLVKFVVARNLDDVQRFSGYLIDNVSFGPGVSTELKIRLQMYVRKAA